jgi:hypothetical protein
MRVPHLGPWVVAAEQALLDPVDGLNPDLYRKSRTLSYPRAVPGIISKRLIRRKTHDARALLIVGLLGLDNPR